jgi:hypothetical protein
VELTEFKRLDAELNAARASYQKALADSERYEQMSATLPAGHRDGATAVQLAHTHVRNARERYEAALRELVQFTVARKRKISVSAQ